MKTISKAAAIIFLSTCAIYVLLLCAPWPQRYQIVSSSPPFFIRLDTGTGSAQVVQMRYAAGEVYFEEKGIIPRRGKWGEYEKYVDEFIRKKE